LPLEIPVDSLPNARRSGPRLATLIAVIALVLAACSGGATPAPTVPPNATNSIAPAATGTPVPSLAASPSAAAVTFPLTLTDDEGTSVQIAKEPAKIVSLTPATTETLFALGVGDGSSARAATSSSTPAASAIPDVRRSTARRSRSTSRDRQLAPDVVFAGGNWHPARRHRAAPEPRPAGRRRLRPDDQKVLDDVSLIGDAVGKPAGPTRSPARCRRASTPCRRR
jgi:ABC-type Fe3+-hydroxamate transport system substrate-binding protein